MTTLEIKQITDISEDLPQARYYVQLLSCHFHSNNNTTHTSSFSALTVQPDMPKTYLTLLDI